MNDYLNRSFLEIMEAMEAYGKWDNVGEMTNKFYALVGERKKSQDLGLIPNPEADFERFWNIAVEKGVMNLSSDYPADEALFAFTAEEMQEHKLLSVMNCGQVSETFVMEAEKLGYEAVQIVAVNYPMVKKNWYDNNNNSELEQYPPCAGHVFAALKDKDDYFVLLDPRVAKMPESVLDCRVIMRKDDEDDIPFPRMLGNRLHSYLFHYAEGQDLLLVRIWKRESEHIKCAQDWFKLCYHHYDDELFPNSKL